MLIMMAFESPPDVLNVHRVVKERGVESYRQLGVASLILFDYAVAFTVAGRERSIEPGTVAFLPPFTARTFRFAGPCLHRTAHLASHAQLEGAAVCLFEAGAAFNRFVEKFDQAHDRFVIRPRHSRAVIWELLWDIHATWAGRAEAALHPKLARAVACIEAHLGERIVIAELAGAVGISHSYLNKLFAAHFGHSVEQHIQGRRMEEARFYLTGTDMPIKEVAARVGLPDLQHFNKVVRRHLGRSPRRVREGEPRRRGRPAPRG